LVRADALWGQAGEGFRDDFLTLAGERYAAGLHEVDFAGDAEHARRTINAWMEVQTEAKIRELLRRGELDPASALVLTNAFWFRGNWASRFDPAATRYGAFRTSGGETLAVPFMHQSGRFAHGREGGLQILDLPYEGGRFSMTILLPDGPGGMEALESSLTPESLERWLGLLRPGPVRVTIPRFRLETRFDLGPALRALGMTDAFDGRRADFSGINGRRDLFLSLVAHGAFVEVDEQGAEAAGASAVVLSKGGHGATDFTADRPFLFLIRDRETGSILFLGRVSDPGAGRGDPIP
jgi:serpin B